jgi:hypothetical protein
LWGSVAIADNNNAVQARPLPVLPKAALDRLARLHVETSEASRLVMFLRASVHAAFFFMLMGACVLFLAGTSMGQNFSWAALVLIGVVALLHSYIRTNAAVFDRAPVSEAARNLRAIFFYMGLAWGAGAFLVLPADLPAVPAILFAAVPALVLTLLLRDMRGLAAFLVPASVLAIAAAFARPWTHPGLDIPVILALQWGPFLGIVMHRRAPFPAGLVLR